MAWSGWFGTLAFAEMVGKATSAFVARLVFPPPPLEIWLGRFFLFTFCRINLFSAWKTTFSFSAWFRQFCKTKLKANNYQGQLQNLRRCSRSEWNYLNRWPWDVDRHLKAGQLAGSEVVEVLVEDSSFFWPAFFVDPPVTSHHSLNVRSIKKRHFFLQGANLLCKQKTEYGDKCKEGKEVSCGGHLSQSRPGEQLTPTALPQLALEGLTAPWLRAHQGWKLSQRWMCCAPACCYQHYCCSCCRYYLP